ncbi:uncharacterized protein LOC128228609 [Mya arenaria]|uniref:uncharacterized protein LOC128228609 n=1 Tax=Mya arenaria TaxID=6604 RepID=UPI0022E5E5D6|nr:uncharacterized protein LOC128228609 [Mya arenaria]
MVSLLLPVLLGLCCGADRVDIVTFNTGLTPRVGHYEERRQEVGAAIRALDAEVVCLQEVWYSDDMERILNAAGEDFLFTYSALHNSAGTLGPTPAMDAPCMTLGFTTEFMPCLMAHCMHADGEMALLTCARDTCHLFETLEQPCITCLALSGIEHLMSRCVENVGSRFNVPGLLLLSRLPLRHVRMHRFFDGAQFIPRGYITAEVEGVGTIACTHTTADLGPPYFAGLEFGSWREQNLAELRQLVEVLKEAPQAVIMGDLNAGPYIPATHVQPEIQESFWYALRHRYADLFTETMGLCTWCCYNPLSGARRNLLLDHVLVRNLTAIAATRVLDNNLPGKTFPASDHFGIRLTLYRR